MLTPIEKEILNQLEFESGYVTLTPAQITRMRELQEKSGLYPASSPTNPPVPASGEFDEDTICDLTGGILNHARSVTLLAKGNVHDFKALLQNALNTAEGYWDFHD